ncbi:hypothetical protein BKA56DRAFT_663714 [Ilyonectria sp. MPI-CAGE-AT-0026]|nr:hypothetical protein BKA56DRAFT_663714 [Ilyonectria sp. MPI-CAGE-AT-0026]
MLFKSVPLALAVLAHGVLGNGQNSSAPLLNDTMARGISALGGLENMSLIQTVVYIGGRTYRTRSLPEAYSLAGVDTVVANAGSQNISFSFDGPQIKQRIDRSHELSAFYYFARPRLDPIEYSLVVQGGEKGFAATVEGSSILFAPTAPPSGYADGLLASFLISEAYRWSPVLLFTIFSNNNYSLREEEILSGQKLPAVYDATLELAVILDPQTYLPYIIRSYENHKLFGRSTHDLLLQDYASVDGVMFPQRFKIYYNGDLLLTDYVADEVLVNTNMEPTLFDAPGSRAEANIPTRDSSYDFAEIGGFHQSYLWNGPYVGTLSNISAINPYPDLPGVWLVVVEDAPLYRQMVLELDDSVIVLDAPPHQSILIIQWALKTLGKPVTHVWPSHHHHDHSMGTADYAAAGAQVIALAQAQAHYSNISASQFVTYTTDAPLVLKSANVEVTFVHMEGSIHSSDHSYAFIKPACPISNSTTLIFDADHGNLATLASGDHAGAFELVHRLANDRVSLNTTYLALSVHMTSQRPSQGLLKLSDTAILATQQQISGLASPNANEAPCVSEGISSTFGESVWNALSHCQGDSTAIFSVPGVSLRNRGTARYIRVNKGSFPME